ncbi:hypothetical protein KSP40_PGU017750 [Platanthera guangdongensis]|uniref:Uncharacterized protein n=1 Tax=Platanthera guangdongensis TaxID=2320717 RepID=A0ABR2LBK8_9ASPA
MQGSRWANFVDEKGSAASAGMYPPNHSMGDVERVGGQGKKRQPGGGFPTTHDAATCQDMHYTQGVTGYDTSNFDWANPNRSKTKGKYDPFTFTESILNFCSDGSTFQMDVDPVHQVMGHFKFALVGKLLGRRVPFFFLLAELAAMAALWRISTDNADH